jgi:ceramide glucosyltransferase
MPLSFVSLTYLTPPFRLTGHIALFSRAVFTSVGGLDGLETQIDDDFELARRLREHGWLAVQTPAVYDINNDLPTARAYHRLLTRWFILPGQSMLPQLPPWQKTVATLSSGPALVIPGVLAMVGLGTRRQSAWLAFGVTLALFGGVYAATERRYLQKRTPLRGWLWLPVAACVTPLHALSALFGRKRVEWRGQTLAIARDGSFEVVECDT